MTLKHEYYKNRLSKNGKEIYEALLGNINRIALDGAVVLHGFNSKQCISDAFDAYFALRYDRPEFYFLNNRVRVIHSSKGTLEIKQDKRFTFTQIKRINSLLRKEINNILENCWDLDVVARERKIYKHIATNYKYGKGEFAHDISGLIVYKKGVCDAIAGLLVIALREAGIPAIRVYGKTRHGGHCWTKVWIEGKPYHLDVTWDLSSHKIFARFRYFNVTEKVILRDHIIN